MVGDSNKRLHVKNIEYSRHCHRNYFYFPLSSPSPHPTPDPRADRPLPGMYAIGLACRYLMDLIIMPPLCTSGSGVSQNRRSVNSREASGGFARRSRSAIAVSLRPRLPEHRGLVLACSVLFASTAIQSSTYVEAFSSMSGSRVSSSYRCTGSLARIPSSRQHASCNRIARLWRMPLDRQPLDEQYSRSKRYTSTGSTAEYSSDDDDNDSKSSGNARKRRPDWAPSWAPTPLVTMRPILQLFVGLVLYIFHLLVLTQHQLVFPVQLIPNDRGWFQSLGLDS